MKKIIFGLLIATSALSTVTAQPAMAQSRNWDAGRFWQGAPAGAKERADFLQSRINAGVRNGGLDRGEADRCQRELDNIRRMQADMFQRNYGRLTDNDRYVLLQRLDDLARSIRWLSNNDWDNGRPPPVAGGWDAGRFWQGAPVGIKDRLAFLQNRIDIGVRNGGLDRGEADRCQRELDNIRRLQGDMYARNYGRLTDNNRIELQQRLDDLARSIRWLSQNGWSDYRPAPPPIGYYPDRDYRDGPQYQPRHLGENDQIYRGNDNRYYCRRSDGTTGLIVGGIAGGVLGNIIAPGGSKALGTILGAGGGAAIGNAVDRNNVTCR